ncbi:hypothetical protein RUND412_011163 [Rhizina undulata]
MVTNYNYITGPFEGLREDETRRVEEEEGVSSSDDEDSNDYYERTAEGMRGYDGEFDEFGAVGNENDGGGGSGFGEGYSSLASGTGAIRVDGGDLMGEY